MATTPTLPAAARLPGGLAGGPASSLPTAPRDPAQGWALRIEDGRVVVVLEHTKLPGGFEVEELAVHLPHVEFPFDFADGMGRFQHHRGVAQEVTASVEAHAILRWVHAASQGALRGRAVDDALVLLGRTEDGVRYTMRARLVPAAESESGGGGPTLLLSVHDVRVYGPTDRPWPAFAGELLDLLPEVLVAERTLTTARLSGVRHAITEALVDRAWKLPDLGDLQARGVELRDGRIRARFSSDRAEERRARAVTLDGTGLGDGAHQRAFERFVEDLELKRHHGQIDRLLAGGQVREALAETYRALDGPPQPGFLAERLIGICASRPILYDEGERVCRALLERSPDHVHALCGLAAISAGRGRPEEAAVHLERLSGALVAGDGAREDRTAADLALAEHLSPIDPAEARHALERVLEGAPDDEEALERLIALAEAAGDLTTALPLYKRLLFSARSPGRTRDAGLRLARHALDRRDPDEARVLLRVVLEAHPHDPDARLALAEVELAQSRRDEAVHVLEGALRGLPASAVSALVRVARRLAEIALTAPAEPGRARRVLWRAADAEGIPGSDLTGLGELALAAGDSELALRLAERAAGDQDEGLAAAWITARAHRARDDDQAVVDACVRVLEADPGHLGALALLEQAPAGVEVRERVLYRVRLAAREAGDGERSASLHGSLARLFESLQLWGDAIQPWEAVLAADPTGALAGDAAEHLLALYERYGMWPRHQQLCARLLERAEEPERRVPLLLRVGRVALEHLGDAGAARVALAEAAELSPRRVQAQELLWSALEALGDAPALVGVLRRLEAIHPDEATRRRAALRLAELLDGELGAAGEARAVRSRMDAAEPRPETPWERALTLADAGRVAEARTVLSALVADQPQHRAAADLLGVLEQLAVEAAQDAPPAPVAIAAAEDAPVVLVSVASDLPPSVSQRLEAGDQLEDLLQSAGAAVAQGDLAAADDLAVQALDLDPDCVEALEVRAASLRAAVAGGDEPAAGALLVVLERLGDLAFDAERTVTLARERARLASSTGSDSEAMVAAWEQVLAWVPLDEEAGGWLTEHYQATARWERLAALHAAREAAAEEALLDAGPGTPYESHLRRSRATAMMARARVHLFRLDDADAAVEAAEGALVLSPDDPEVLEVLIRALAVTNQREACRAAIDRLLPLLMDGPLKDEMSLLRGN